MNRPLTCSNSNTEDVMKTKLSYAEACRKLQNVQWTRLSVHEFKDLMLQVKSTADQEIASAEEERRKAEEERQKAEEERQKAEEERQKAEEERQKAEKRYAEVSTNLETVKKRIRTEVVPCLDKDLAPLVAPQPINADKERCLALLSLKTGREWYIIRRQRESFEQAIVDVLAKYSHAIDDVARLVKSWYGVPHSVDVGNSLKQRLRDVHWEAHGNILRIVDKTSETYTDAQLVDAIENTLRENAAIALSRKIINIIK